MKTLTSLQFMNERRVGLIVRGFAKKPGDVLSRIEMMDELVKKALASVVHNKRLLNRVDILVWANQTNYPGEADCGALAPALREHFKWIPEVFVHEVRTGDLFCSILNYGVAKQSRAGCDYSIIASAEANAYWASDIPLKMIELAGRGARAVGVAINELTESVREGRIANTMAMWHNESLLTVGGFDFRAAKPQSDKLARFARGFDARGEKVYYQIAGVEEVIPLARLVDTFGTCIGVVESSDLALRYTMPDPSADPEEYKRHVAKFGTKKERQTLLLAEAGYVLDYLFAGVMRN